MKAKTEAGIEPRDPQQGTGDSKVAEWITETSPKKLAAMEGVKGTVKQIQTKN